MSEEKKKGFFARLGFGQANGSGCGCSSSVEIVSEEKVQRLEDEKKKVEKDAKKAETSGCCG